jgi:septum formation protein
VTARQLVLGSASPARRATLLSAGIDPIVIVSGVDESQLDGLPPVELALQLAELKCAAVAGRDDLPPDVLVLGCDSVLELDGVALGKPDDAEDAVRRWRSMRGRSGVLLTGHCLRDVATGAAAAATASTRVLHARSGSTRNPATAYSARMSPFQMKT